MARILCGALAMCALASPGCNRGDGLRLRVSVSCVPPDATSMMATFALDSGAPASRTWSRETGLDSEENFDVYVPRAGVLTIELTAGDASATANVSVPEQAEVAMTLAPGCEDAGVDVDAAGLPMPCAGGIALACDGRRYVACPQEVNWDVALAECMAAGGCLAQLETVEEDACVRAQLLQSLEAPPIASFWIGLHQDDGATAPALDWRWTCSQEPLTYSGWGGSEPNDGAGTEDGSQQCAAFDFERPDLMWEDQACATTTERWICEF
jgi:hypothetical protein